MRNRALKLTIGLASVGLVIILFTVFVQRGILKTYNQNLPYITLFQKMNNDAISSRIAFEKLLSGDPGVNFDVDVQGPLKANQVALQAMYNNAPTEGRDYTGLQDDESRMLTKQAIFDVEKVVDVAGTRWKANVESIVPATDSTAAMGGSKAGDALALQFDLTFDQSVASLQTLQDHIENRLSNESSWMDILSWVSIGLLTLAFAGICYWLFTLQQNSSQMAREHDARLSQQGKTVKSLSSFIEAISAGNYAADLELQDDGNNLGTTLLSMRDKLKIDADDDRKRNWSTSGLAQIGEILRVNSTSTTELYDNIIKFVVKYTRSNQGGLFILSEENEGDKFLELTACYAFERKKYLTRKIVPGEGLVGQCFLEGEKIYLLEVPEEYVTITSGLGGSPPNALLLVPLKVNDRIFGVLELATFEKYAPHEVELVEKLTESIASTISAVRISESTRILLEKTQQQAEEMRAQEEEMRQNMEELEATQEEMRRKEKHIQNMLDGEQKRNDISNKNRQMIMELTKTKVIQEGKWEESLEKITTAVARQLNVSRCSIWEYDRSENKITCAKLYTKNKDKFESGQVLLGRDYPAYMEALTSEETILANDAHTHPGTREFSTNYFQVHSIQSLLDVPFFNEGKITGIVCCEQTHEQKEWSDEDVEFLKSCADLITVAYNTAKINAMLDKLSDDQETMQTIIDNIPRAVFWKDRDLKFLGCNKLFAQGAGIKSPNDLIGKRDHDMPWKEHADAYGEDDKAVMSSRKARLNLEERNVNSEGVESWVMTSKVPVLNKHDEVVAVLGMFEDITERKRKEAHMEATHRELEELRKLVGKRTN
ncbi:MAG: GAF domain-containing protein [Chryseolinea sp.]